MSNQVPFTGMGINPHGPDLPMGFSMNLSQDPQAMANYGKLTDAQKSSVIRYIQSGATGDEAAARIQNALNCLRGGNIATITLG